MEFIKCHYVLTPRSAYIFPVHASSFSSPVQEASHHGEVHLSAFPYTPPPSPEHHRPLPPYTTIHGPPLPPTKDLELTPLRTTTQHSSLQTGTAQLGRHCDSLQTDAAEPGHLDSVSYAAVYQSSGHSLPAGALPLNPTLANQGMVVKHLPPSTNAPETKPPRHIVTESNVQPWIGQLSEPVALAEPVVLTCGAKVMLSGEEERKSNGGSPQSWHSLPLQEEGDDSPAEQEKPINLTGMKASQLGLSVKRLHWSVCMTNDNSTMTCSTRVYYW